MANSLTGNGLYLTHTYSRSRSSCPSSPSVGAIWEYYKSASDYPTAILPSGGTYLYIGGVVNSGLQANSVSGGTVVSNSNGNAIWLRMS